MQNQHQVELSPALLAQLEAEPLRDNEQLLGFAVRSRNVDWRRYVQPLDAQVRAPAVYLDRHADFVSGHRVPLNDANRRELLVCHDMMGNYLADRHYHSSEKYDDFRFVHWAAVDYFCYFSHQYITIPPCGWLNAAHRHGVAVLGTYIVEGEMGSRLLHEALDSIASVDRIVAALIRLCRHFGFEGWLVNVECKVRPTSMSNLYYFVRQLRVATEAEVPHGRVFWYDSVIDTGELSWQNEVNAHNVAFFRVSHAMLINYTWNDSSLAATAATAKSEHAPPHRAFLGLDVFGRGQVGRFHSAQTLARIAAGGFSAGVFAPAWCFETLQQFGYNIRSASGNDAVNAAFLARNERWWARLWEWLATHPYSSLPFYTDFCVGSGRVSFRRGARLAATRPFFNLSRQALQPSVPLGSNAAHSFSTAYSGGCSLRLLNTERAFRLFVTEFALPPGQQLLLGYAYKIDESQGAAMDVVLRYCATSQKSQELYIFCGQYEQPILAPGRCFLAPLAANMAPDLPAHPELPLDGSELADGWRVRYYMMRFDGPVLLQDIGVKHRPELQSAAAYLGAIYVHSPESSTTAGVEVDIDVYQKQLWSTTVAT